MSQPARPRILIVDDSKVQIRMLRKLLADSDYEVVGEAYSGTEAIELFSRLRPEVVITDIVMPDMDGVKALEAIQKIDPEARVIMSSSLGTKEKVMETLQKGARSFLMKPYDREDLLRTLRSLVRPAAPAPMAKFFGQFLLERGRISREQLLEAVRHQSNVNVKLGTLAIDRGLLTVEQVKSLNQLQRRMDKKFGELAIDQGMLTRPQVEELLAQQKQDRLLLGEALVHKGYLALEELEDELRAFRKDQEGIAIGIHDLYRDHPNARVLEIFADLITKMMQRIADEIVRPGTCHSDLARARTHDFTICQGLRGSFSAVCCLSLTSDLLTRIASRMLDEGFREPDEVAQDGGKEFMNIVNGNVCASLSAIGLQSELEPPTIHDNRTGKPFDLEKEAAGGYLTCTPLLHPHSGIEWVLIDRSLGGPQP